MTARTKSKEVVVEIKLVDFMPKWAKEEKCFKEVVLRDIKTKKIVEGGWPRQKSVEQRAYENWFEKVVNAETGEFHPERNNEGAPIKRTGARYIVTVITRTRDNSGKREYLSTKGRLIGFNSSGIKVERPIKELEVWSKQNFAYERTYNEKTGSFTVQTVGPSNQEQVYDIPFSPENALKLYEKVQDDDCQFVLKDLRTGDAKEVKWSSVKDTLDLFCHKSFDYLWKADYMPPPVKMELRQEAIAQGLIGGVASDFNMQPSLYSKVTDTANNKIEAAYS